MKIEHVPQFYAERIIPTENMACISITEPGYLADLNGWKHLLRLKFDDVDKNQFASEQLHSDVLYLTPSFFTVEQAKEIRDFVQSLPTEVEHLVVHCHAGISRSAAVSLVLHEWYGVEVVEANRFALHNRYVAAILRDVMKRTRS